MKRFACVLCVALFAVLATGCTSSQDRADVPDPESAVFSLPPDDAEQIEVLPMEDLDDMEGLPESGPFDEMLELDPDLDDIRSELIGLDLQAAKTWARDNGFSLRVVKENDERLMVTLDFSLSRINVATVDGLITEVDGLG